MKNESKSLLFGYAYGLLNGISMRKDIPDDVVDICKNAYKKYEEYCQKQNEET